MQPAASSPRERRCRCFNYFRNHSTNFRDKRRPTSGSPHLPGWRSNSVFLGGTPCGSAKGVATPTHAAPHPSPTQGVPPCDEIDTPLARPQSALRRARAPRRLARFPAAKTIATRLHQHVRGRRYPRIAAAATRRCRPRADRGRHGRRTISAKHLYLAGMTEQSFPSPEPAGQLATPPTIASSPARPTRPGPPKPRKVHSRQPARRKKCCSSTKC